MSQVEPQDSNAKEEEEAEEEEDQDGEVEGEDSEEAESGDDEDNEDEDEDSDAPESPKVELPDRATRGNRLGQVCRSTQGHLIRLSSAGTKRARLRIVRLH